MCVCIHHSEIITAVKSSNSSVGCTSFIHVSVILSCYTKNTMHLGEHSVNLPHENHFHIYLIITERNPERLTKSLWRKGKVLAAKINKRQLGPDAQERLKEQMDLKLPQSKCLLASYLYREGSRQVGSYCSKRWPTEEKNCCRFWVQCLTPCQKSPGLKPLPSRPRGIRDTAVLRGSRSKKDRAGDRQKISMWLWKPVPWVNRLGKRKFKEPDWDLRS